MGKMALGYGSEFHLLRWLGRHRNEFDKRVKELLNIDNISWLDFDFDLNKKVLDRELVGLSFLKDDINFDIAIANWKSEWPQSGNSMNWDLIGFTKINNLTTWILVEAKAHIGELEQSCGATINSFLKIEKALEKAAANSNIEILPQNPWTKKYYQLANRIYVLDLLKRSDINAKLLNIYFVGDVLEKRKSPQNQKEWSQKIGEMKKYLNIQNAGELGISDLYLEVNK